MNTLRRLRVAAGLACTFAFACVGAFAEGYPSKPVRFVIGFPAGSSIDVVSRIVIDDIAQRTGATIVVDNRPGALGALGLDVVARAPADGYTLTASSSATHSSGPHLLKALARTEPVTGFTHIGRMVQFDIAVVTSSAGPYRSAHALVDAAKAKPDTLTYGYGSGTGQVSGAAFSMASGVRMRAVPYKGQPPAITDLVGGQIDYVAADVGALLPLVRQGSLTAVAVLADRRSTLMPTVPTMRELGFGDLGLLGWIGIDAPAHLPADVAAWWVTNLKASLASAPVQQKLRSIGMEPEPLFGDAFAQFVVAENARWGRSVAAAGIVAE